MVNRRKDGTIYVEAQTITPICSKGEEITHFIAIKEDITKQKKSEETIREKEARIRAVLTGAVDAIITIDERGFVDSFNPAAEKMFGFQASEILNRNVNLLMPPEQAARHDGYIRHYLETGEARIIGIGRETVGRKKSGEDFPMELAVSKVNFSEKTLFTGIIRDITERRRAEQAILDAKARLEENKKKIDADLMVAADIQKGLLPKRLPDVQGIRIAWRFTPCHFVGGDIFNVLLLDPDHLAIYMLDVSGHGVASAFVTVAAWQLLQLHTGFLLRADRKTALSPGEALEALDKEFPMERFDKYFTMFYMIADLRDGRLRYSNAGHTRPVLLRSGGAQEDLEEGGTVIGMGGIVPFEEGEKVMGPGDKVCLYTDGLTEYRNPAGEMFGTERLQDYIARHGRGSPEELTTGIYDALTAFSNGRETDDDISLLVMEYLGRR